MRQTCSFFLLARSLLAWNPIDAKAAAATPLASSHDNSFVEEIERTGMFAELSK